MKRKGTIQNGILIAILLAIGIFQMGIAFELRKFFYFSSILLILLAGGLAGYGVHELLEYSESVGHDAGWLGSYAFNLNVSSDSMFHHKGVCSTIRMKLVRSSPCSSDSL